MKIDFTNTDRQTILDYLNAKELASKYSKLEKTLKANVIALFDSKSHAMDGTDKTEKVYATIQKDNKAMKISLATTSRMGSIGWEDAYNQLWLETYGTMDGAAEWAEQFRKSGTIATTIKVVEDK